MSLFDIHKIQNHPEHSTFDLSQSNKMTAKVGQLLPACVRTLCPGDHVSANLQHYTQTVAINTNAQIRINEHFDAFFVPFRLLYSKANDVLTDISTPQVASTQSKANNTVPSSLPYTNYPSLYYGASGLTGNDICGFSRTKNTFKLLAYLGYSDLTNSNPTASTTTNSARANIPLSVMPLLAYQKIYADFFRFQQWETLNPYSYNTDWKGNTVLMSNENLDGTTCYGSKNYGEGCFDLRYVNYNKDYLFGVLPSQVSDVYVSSNNASFLATGGSSSSRPAFVFDTSGFVNTTHSDPLNVSIKNFSTNISVLQLRSAYALQKWSEIQLMADNNYKDKIKHHFGVDVPDYTAFQSQYLGGYSSVIKINDIINNNLTGDNKATRGGTGDNAGAGRVEFDCKEHGIFMILYYATPLLDYNAEICYDPNVTFVSSDDFPKPEFDKLGLEPVRSYLFGPGSGTAVAGYAPRYWAFKSVIDYYRGGFSNGYDNYVISKDLTPWTQYGFQLSYPWFKVNPKDVNNVFCVQAGDTVESDQLLINFHVDMKKSSPLSYSGLPY